MLTRLSIRNVVLIESLDLDFSEGLTALTGETGAGKSIVLDALGMALGARSDKGLVRSGADKAQVTAVFELDSAHPIWNLLNDNEIDAQAEEPLILRRTLNSDGRSKAFINDMPVSVRQLSMAGDALLEVHGQHDGRGLLDPSEHINMLDVFGGLGAQRDSVQQAYAAQMTAQTRLDDLRTKADKLLRERDYLAASIEELERLSPVPGEDVSLAAERKFLQGAESALSELETAEQALGDDGSFEGRLSAALAGIERVRNKLEGGHAPAIAALDAAAQALEKALLETQEARHAVAQAAMTFDIEPGKLDDIEQRLFALRGAARKFGTDVESLPAKSAEFRENMQLIENIDLALDKGQKDLKAAQRAYNDAAKKLSAERQKAAQRLEASVATELPPLKMERANFEVSIEPSAPSASGIDKIRFEIQTNPGTTMGPLDKIASGGELARFALAIKVSLATDKQKIMVFDEVDQGVGGAVASAVGRRLSQLSKDGQVFVVTHSPQVAASADHQFRIDKSSTGETTTSEVVAVLAEAREEEIARMLAGDTITTEARAAARRLMKAS